MTNIFGAPQKRNMKRKLFEVGVSALERQGWKISRADGGGSSVRKITKNGQTKIVSIRTTQDTHIAFPRNRADTGWITLSDVDAVVAVSVDDQHQPKFALVHFLPGEEMRDRFDRTYSARKKAGHVQPLGRGIWLSLYKDEAKEPPALVGAGAGNKHLPIAKILLDDLPTTMGDIQDDEESEYQEIESASDLLTIAEAKRRLALSLGVPVSSIKITIEG